MAPEMRTGRRSGQSPSKVGASGSVATIAARGPPADAPRTTVFASPTRACAARAAERPVTVPLHTTVKQRDLLSDVGAAAEASRIVVVVDVVSRRAVVAALAELVRVEVVAAEERAVGIVDPLVDVADHVVDAEVV